MIFALAAVAVLGIAPTGAVSNAGPRAPTPMAQRVATIAALNKQNGRVQEFLVRPGTRIAFGRLSITLRSCETTPPWERPVLTGAFVQIDDVSVRKRLFSGWLYAESPSLNSFDHPVYDVWVRNCAMTFPEVGPDTIVPGKSKDSVAPSAPKSAVTPSASDSAPR